MMIWLELQRNALTVELPGFIAELERVDTIVINANKRSIILLSKGRKGTLISISACVQYFIEKHKREQP